MFSTTQSEKVERNDLKTRRNLSNSEKSSNDEDDLSVVGEAPKYDREANEERRSEEFIRTSFSDPATVGGIIIKATSEIIPFQISLSTNENRPVSFCGGVLLNKYHVITASHCLLNKDKNIIIKSSSFVIRVGIDETKVNQIYNTSIDV